LRGRLTGRLAFVTLAEERGESIARALAGEGATVVLVTADGERGGRLAEEIRAANGGRVAVFCGEADASADLDALVELAAELAPRP